MPNSKTFDIPPIAKLLSEEVCEGVWLDPFSNGKHIASITNDLNPDVESDFHMDALDFLKTFGDGEVDGVLYDPPYSPRQIAECYKGVGMEVSNKVTQSSFWGEQKREIARITRSGGKVISFGWNSGGIGKKHGFSIKRILLVPHGGWHNDTIVTVEIKDTLF